MKRRDLLKFGGASLVLWPLSSWALADSRQRKHQPKLVWLVLRGAVDSLHTLVPTFDADLAVLRPQLHQAIKDQLLPLDQGFALHPSLKNLHAWYQKKELLPIMAVTSGYGARSHFDGQDHLESGLQQTDPDNGWLARASLQASQQALAIARSTPISLRGKAHTDTWYPSALADANESTYDALMKLYQEDPLLQQRLSDGLAIEQKAKGNMANTKKTGKFIDLARSCAQLMNAEKGANCAMLEMGGWDTHKGQVYRLEKNLAELDKGLAALKEGLGEHWPNTLVIIATEFGRTAKENGTGGTDHGTGSALFLAGGAVDGGKILGKWPGLSPSALFEQRDLAPTSNLFGWVGAALAQHWQLSDQQVANIFPHVTPYHDYQLINSHFTNKAI